MLFVDVQFSRKKIKKFKIVLMASSTLLLQASVYFASEKFLTGNDREFVNTKFIEMVEALGITVKTKAAEQSLHGAVNLLGDNLVLSR